LNGYGLGINPGSAWIERRENESSTTYSDREDGEAPGGELHRFEFQPRENEGFRLRILNELENGPCFAGSGVDDRQSSLDRIAIHGDQPYFVDE
jgi:hypothetical protein